MKAKKPYQFLDSIGGDGALASQRVEVERGSLELIAQARLLLVAFGQLAQQRSDLLVDACEAKQTAVMQSNQ